MRKREGVVGVQRSLRLACLLAVLVGPVQWSSRAESLPTLAPGDSLGLALGLSCATNLRDLGGYRTGDGRQVKRDFVYRSDVFNPMTDADVGKLQVVGLKTDFDLRTTAEVERQPDRVPAGVEYVRLDVLGNDRTFAKLGPLLQDPKQATKELGGGRIERMFIAGYRGFVSLPSARESYRGLFTALADPNELPAVFHCTTGKDRTGWAAAALLTLLGVPRETVMADYLRTNDYLLPYYAKPIDGFAAAGGDRAIAEAIFGVKPEYLDAAFDEVQNRYGSIERYFSKGLGLDASAQATLRMQLTEAVAPPVGRNALEAEALR